MKKKTIKSGRGQTSQINKDAGSVFTRRQVSVGLSGILLAGTMLESSGHSTLRALTTKPPILPAQVRPQKLTPHTFNQPQYVLSGPTESVWSPDSQHIATFQENTVTLYRAFTGKPELTYCKHTDEILTVKWSADSKYIASSGFDHIVHVWDAVLGQTVMMYEGHTDIVRDIAWSPGQQYIASTGYDKTVQVWKALTGKTIITYSGHTAEVQAITWSPDGRLIASTDLHNKTIIWRVM